MSILEDMNANLKDRVQAAAALGELGDNSAISPLVTHLRVGVPEELRHAALDALERMISGGANPGPLRALMMAAIEGDSWVLQATRQVIRNVPSDKVRQDDRLRYFALTGQWDAVVEMGTDAVKALSDWLRSTRDEYTREQLVDALVRIASYESIDTLVSLFLADSVVGPLARQALVRANDPRVGRCLVEALASRDRYLDQAQDLLAAMTNRGVQDSVIAALRNQLVHGRTVKYAVKSLRRLGYVPDETDEVYFHVGEDSWESAAAMGRRAVPGLLKLLEEPDCEVVLEVFRALAAIRDPAAAEPVLKYSCKSGRAVLEKMRLLGLLKSKEAIPWLLERFEYRPPWDWETGNAAREALVEIGDAVALKRVAELERGWAEDPPMP